MEAARQRGEREGYPPGGHGMSHFLSEWQRRFDGGRAVRSCISYNASCMVLEKRLLICNIEVEDEKL